MGQDLRRPASPFDVGGVRRTRERQNRDQAADHQSIEGVQPAEPRQRAFIIEYDDFNSYLDSFRERLSSRQRKADKALQNWRLWDHMDALLTLAVTRLADAVRLARNGPTKRTVSPTGAVKDLNRMQRRDLLLLAACYDNNREYSPTRRFSELRKALGFPTWKTWWDLILGVVITLVTVLLVLKFGES
ncbi:MAG: hypothetical protein R3B90_19640 [Planctomycetaceae bacterium]